MRLSRHRWRLKLSLLPIKAWRLIDYESRQGLCFCFRVTWLPIVLAFGGTCIYKWYKQGWITIDTLCWAIAIAISVRISWIITERASVKSMSQEQKTNMALAILLKAADNKPAGVFDIVKKHYGDLKKGSKP